MITPDERRKIKHLANEFAKGQVALAFNPDDKQTRREAAEDITALEDYLKSISTPEPT